MNLDKFGPITVHVDADVLEADGGTRTAAITGAYVAVADALKSRFPETFSTLVRAPIAAVSAGIVGGEAMLDLDYSEDSRRGGFECRASWR